MARIETLLPYLSLLRIEGKPYSLEEFKPLEPMFKLTLPPRTTLKKGRQVSASTCSCASGLLLAAAIPNFKVLYTTLEFTHAEELAKTRLSELARSPYFKNHLLRGDNVIDTYFHKILSNNSSLYVSYLLNNPDRVRGFSGDLLFVDEAQDMVLDQVLIASSCLNRSRYSIRKFAGTPKTKTTFLEECWEDSSQAEFVVPCDACGHWNIPREGEDLLKMLGPTGPVCGDCLKPVNPDDARAHWVHTFKDRVGVHDGYHLPQSVMAAHFFYPHKWDELKYDQQKAPYAQFMNERMGVAVDEGVVLISEAQIRNACALEPFAPNTYDAWSYQSAVARSKTYKWVVMGIDWGGKGESTKTSRTVVTLVGKNPGMPYECFWAKVFPITEDPMVEIATIDAVYKDMGPKFVAHDILMSQAYDLLLKNDTSIPEEKIIGIANSFHPKQDLMFPVAGRAGVRPHFSIDRTRALLVVVEGIKRKKILFPPWEVVSEALKDLVSLQNDFRESRTTGHTLFIGRRPKQSDDFAHALDYAVHLLIWIIGNDTGNSGGEYNYLLSGSHDLTSLVRAANLNK